MVDLGEQLIGCRHKRISLGLQLGSAALLRLNCPPGQPCEKTIHLLAQLRGGAETDIHGQIFPGLAPDGLSGAKVRAAKWQDHQAKLRPGVGRWDCISGP